jgi:hypothetical protein
MPPSFGIQFVLWLTLMLIGGFAGLGVGSVAGIWGSPATCLISFVTPIIDTVPYPIDLRVSTTIFRAEHR